MLRLPADLHRQLAQAAKKADQSLNQELVGRLKKSFTVEAELAERESMAALVSKAGRTFDDLRAVLEKAGTPVVLSSSAEPTHNQADELPKRAEELNK